MTDFPQNRPQSFLHNRQRAQRMALLAIAFIVFFALNGFIAALIYKERQSQQIFQQQFGDDWQQSYEKRNGPGSLARAHTQAIIGVATMPVIGLLLLLIYRQATRDRSGGLTLAEQRKKYKEPDREW